MNENKEILSDQLLDKVVAQILEDVKNEDLTAIYELIEPLPTDSLESYLSEIELDTIEQTL